MESLKNPATILTIGNTAVLLAVSVYFYREMVKLEKKNMDSETRLIELSKEISRLSENNNNVQDHQRTIKKLIKNLYIQNEINLKLETTLSLQSKQILDLQAKLSQPIPRITTAQILDQPFDLFSSQPSSTMSLLSTVQPPTLPIQSVLPEPTRSTGNHKLNLIDFLDESKNCLSDDKPQTLALKHPQPTNEKYQDEKYQDEKYQDEKYQDEKYQDEKYQDEKYQDVKRHDIEKEKEEEDYDSSPEYKRETTGRKKRVEQKVDRARENEEMEEQVDEDEVDDIMAQVLRLRQGKKR